jgi:hypothetical protein
MTEAEYDVWEIVKRARGLIAAGQWDEALAQIKEEGIPLLEATPENQ